MKKERINSCIFILPFLCILCLYGLPIEESAAQTTLFIIFGFPEEALLDRDTTGSGQKAQQLLINTAVLPTTMPKALTEVEETEKNVDEEERFTQELNQLGALLSFDGFSNDTLGRSGNAYGLSATYERDIEPVTFGGIIDYRLFRLSNKFSDDYNSNRLSGLIYADYTLSVPLLDISAGAAVQSGYTINNQDNEDFANYGGGGYVTLSKNMNIFEVALGATYMYTQYDLNLDDDHSHLVKYGVVMGVPIGEKLAASIYFVDTRNITNYEIDLIDNNFFTLGTEWVISFARSWVISLGYRTILGFEDYDSHEGYLGSMLKF